MGTVTRDGTRLGAEPGRAAAGGSAAVPEALAAKAAAENFPVALRLLPPRRRRQLMAVYWFARVTDDIGDRAPPPDRLRLLDELDADLGRLSAGTARREEVRALAPVVAECGVPVGLFADLIQANRQDQVVSRYQTFDELLGYCQLSANPVGRIVLHVFGAFSPGAATRSDSVCTGLQLVEHWQDVAEDLQAGRVYLPQQDLADFGCTEADLAAAQASPRLRSLIAFESARARDLLDAGAPLVGTLRGSARAAVAGFVAGGRAAVAAIAAADHDVLRTTPRPRRSRLIAELARTFVRGR
ncbi:MAG TPA: squalene synthase HpnC [Streptosporangiaceae bacterium]|nr:squalene synthase HpnC [Streptosporangiaceae bacterium]